MLNFFIKYDIICNKLRGIVMNNSTLNDIIILAEDKTLNGDKLKKLTEQGCRLVSVMNEESYSLFDTVKKKALVPKTFITGLKAIYQEIHDIKNREKVVSRVFNFDSNLVTGDLATFIGSKTRFPYFVDSFQYDASVSLDRMDSLKFVWGDIDLRKLHDFSHVKSLNVVMGDFYASTAKNPEGLQSLQVVTGDMHMEQFENVDFLNPSLYVGGAIYTKNGVHELTSYQKSYK